MNYYIYCKDTKLSKAHQDAVKEYIKRLSAYCKVQLITGSKKTDFSHLSSANHQVIFLEKGISTYTSEAFAKEIQTMEASGRSNIHIYIGYDKDGLMSQLQKKEITVNSMAISNCDLSSATLCVLFAEQLYRGYTILQGKTYHK